MTEPIGWFLAVVLKICNSIYKFIAIAVLVKSTSTKNFWRIYLPVSKKVILDHNCDWTKYNTTCDVSIDTITAANAYVTAGLEAAVIAVFLCLLYATNKKSMKMTLPAFWLILIDIVYTSLIYIVISTKGILLNPWLLIYQFLAQVFNIFIWLAIYMWRQRHTEVDYELATNLMHQLSKEMCQEEGEKKVR